MKNVNRYSHYILVVSTVFLFVACGSSEKQTEYGKATKELISMVESNPELKSMLITSIEKAHQINPDINTNPVQNLDPRCAALFYSILKRNSSCFL